MKVGFTGTRKGMTEAQRTKVAQVLYSLKDRGDTATFHHGDCVGSDAQAHDLANATGFAVFVHPPKDSTLRAGCTGYLQRYQPLPYHTRNRNIVNAAEVLIATPAEMEEQSRGGTWFTVRYARSQGKKLVIVWPNGETSRE